MSRCQVYAQDMMHTAVKDTKAWRAVIIDETTVKVLSSVMRMSDLMNDHNIAVVEDLNKNRQPMRDIPGVYFVEPSAATVSRLAFDFGSRSAFEPGQDWENGTSDGLLRRGAAACCPRACCNNVMG